jgi:hypothetical protein
MQAPPATTRQAVIAVMRRSFALSARTRKDTRSFRNRLVIMTALSVLAASALLVVQWRLPDAAIVQPPDGGTDMARWALLLLVMIAGMIGALVSAIPSVAAIPRSRGPYNFPLQQALLKVALGSLTAVIGVIVIGNTGVSGFESVQALVGVAVVFGAAQQVVTQFLDRRAGELVAAQTTP